jgi:hypothetical protein
MATRFRLEANGQQSRTCDPDERRRFVASRRDSVPVYLRTYQQDQLARKAQAERELLQFCGNRRITGVEFGREIELATAVGLWRLDGP